MMDRDIDKLEGPEPERPSQDPATQPASAAVGPQPYNAASADHLHDYTPAGEQHTISSAYQLPELPHLYFSETELEQLLRELEPQQSQERVSPPSCVTVPVPDRPVAYRTPTANTALSNLRPPLPTDLQNWADVSMYEYMHYVPGILTWNNPPFITQQHHWNTIQETGDEAAAVESLPARFVEPYPARFVEPHPARFVEPPPARFVDSRLVNAPMWGYSSQMPVHTSGHIPVLPPVNLPTPACSVKSEPARSVNSEPAHSVKRHARSAKSKPARSVKAPARRRYESPPAYMPWRPVPLDHTPLPPLFYPPVAHSTHMPFNTPALMPLHPPAPLPLHPPAPLPLLPPAEGPEQSEHPSVQNP